jgi:hypothetical protein
MKCRIVLLSLCSIAIMGCNGGANSMTTTQFCNKKAQAICESVSPACLTPVSGCISGQVAQCLADAQYELGNSRDFIPHNAEDCLKKVKEVYGKLDKAIALKAAELQAMDLVCAMVYRGTSMANGPCTVDADCLEDMICDKNRCGNWTLKAQGEGCANIGEYCPQGFYCGDSLGVKACIPRVGLMSTCNEVMAINKPVILCAEVLRCVGEVCIQQLGIGETCAGHQDCASGFCEPYALKCGEDLRFANGSAACIAISGG